MAFKSLYKSLRKSWKRYMLVVTGIALGAGGVLVYQHYTAPPLVPKQEGQTLDLQDLLAANDSIRKDYAASLVLTSIGKDTLVSDGDASIPTITMALKQRTLPRPFLALDKERLREQYLAVFDGRALVQEVVAQSTSDEFQLELGSGAAQLGISGLSGASREGTYSLTIGYPHAYQTVLHRYAIHTGIPGQPSADARFDKTAALLQLLPQLTTADSATRKQLAHEIIQQQIDSTFWLLERPLPQQPYLFNLPLWLDSIQGEVYTFRGEHPVNRLLRLSGAANQRTTLVMKVPASLLDPVRKANLEPGIPRLYEVFGFVEYVIQEPSGKREVVISPVTIL